MPGPHYQTTKFSITSTGFKILNYYSTSKKNRFVDVSLKEVHAHQQDNNTYIISSQHIKESIATLIHVNISDISVDENDFFFTLEDMKSKTVPVVFQSNLKLRKQYEIYNEPQLTPKEILVYGPNKVIDSINVIYTKTFTKEDIHTNIKEKIALDFLNGQLQSNTKEVEFDINVEKYTEVSLSVPIEPKDNIRYFPEKITVSYLVAIRDFQLIDEHSFHVTVDSTDLQSLPQFLKIQVNHPKNVKLVRVEPKQIEYLIVQDNL